VTSAGWREAGGAGAADCRESIAVTGSRAKGISPSTSAATIPSTASARWPSSAGWCLPRHLPRLGAAFL